MVWLTVFPFLFCEILIADLVIITTRGKGRFAALLLAPAPYGSKAVKDKAMTSNFGT